MTQQGGGAAFESLDGRRLYYPKIEPGLWSRPLAGGAETKHVDTLRCWGYWTLAPQGIYFLDDTHWIRLLKPSGETEDVMPLGGEPACSETGLSVSPDGRSLIYVKAERESDLMMIDLGRAAVR
jgi:hypothetical protein